MIPISKLVSRDVFGTWLQDNGITGHGVEIGTYYGTYAHVLARQWTAGQVFTVDPYSWDKDQSYVDGCKLDFSIPERPMLDPVAVYLAAKEKLAGTPNCTMIGKTSIEASAMFFDDSLAFVYLDGNHAEEAVEADIAAWLPKVRSGGIFAGHDFYNRDDELMKGGVFNAVWKFAHEKNWKPHVTQCTSWWFIKP